MKFLTHIFHHVNDCYLLVSFTGDRNLRKKLYLTDFDQSICRTENWSVSYMNLANTETQHAKKKNCAYMITLSKTFMSSDILQVLEVGISH